jgi:DNA-binding GntR family transcriptional regulator
MSGLIFSLREQIVDQLRNDLLCGRFAEGERLSEVQLVERFGVSRTPIREALQQLTQEGLLEGRPNSGVKVAARPPDSIREFVVPIRRSVEIFALRSFFHEINEADYKRWNEILEKLRIACAASDFTAIGEQDIAFHQSLVRRAHQRDVEAIWTMLISRVRSHFWQTQRKRYSDPIEVYREHAHIIEVFRTGDLDASIKVLEENID